MVWPQSVISTKRQLLGISAIGVSNQPHRASISSHIICHVEQNLIHHKIVRIYCLNIALQDLYSFHDTMTFCCSCSLLDCLWLSTALSMISSPVSFSSPPHIICVHICIHPPYKPMCIYTYLHINSYEYSYPIAISYLVLTNPAISFLSGNDKTYLFTLSQEMSGPSFVLPIK